MAQVDGGNNQLFFDMFSCRFRPNLARSDTVNNGRRRCLYGHSGSMNLGAQSLKIFNIELAGTDH